VDVVESLGSEQHVLVALAHGPLAVRTAAGLRLEPGAKVRLHVRAEHLHLFDAASGRRIGP
jgi:ABC-type sugar transport system ATPase subunit